MKNLILKVSAILVLFVLTSYIVKDESIGEKKLIGTWEYSVPDAPQQYQKGEIIFVKNEGNLEGNLAINGYKTLLKNLSSKKNNVTCEAYISGENISFDLTFDKKSFIGTASYSEGSLDITGHKRME